VSKVRLEARALGSESPSEERRKGLEMRVQPVMYAPLLLRLYWPVVLSRRPGRWDSWSNRRC
jgi:hypothetical protein